MTHSYDMFHTYHNDTFIWYVPYISYLYIHTIYSRRTYHIDTIIPYQNSPNLQFCIWHGILYFHFLAFWHIHKMCSIHRMLTHSYHIFHIHAMVWMCQYDMFGTHDMNVSIWYMVSNHEQDLGLCLDVPASLGLGLALNLVLLQSKTKTKVSQK